MIGLDTNVLVRYFAQDDATQSAAANKVMANLSKDAPGFVSLVVLCELVWVLEDAYNVAKPQLIELLVSVLESDEFVIERKPVAWAALEQYRASGLDFSDAVISLCGLDAGCQHTLTFDRAASKARGFQLLKA
ncbi:MAG: type II toxin-antitoxin system VapC family toxin [Burkholderiales bacterium]|nr:type II toxin-antitoxin system VapC family toxin [Burkholderiales bacterium]